MNLKEIKELIEIFNKSDINQLKIKQDVFEIKLDKSAGYVSCSPQVMPAVSAPLIPQAPVHSEPAIPAPAASGSGDFILSPMVGTFYHRPSPDSAPFIKVGDTVRKGQTIGIIEAMKIMNEIEAEYDCKIIAIEANDAQPVEFGSRLIKVEKL